jgi:hypothetical protein
VLEEGVVVVVDGWVLLGLEGLKEGEGFGITLRHFQRQIGGFFLFNRLRGLLKGFLRSFIWLGLVTRGSIFFWFLNGWRGLDEGG